MILGLVAGTIVISAAYQRLSPHPVQRQSASQTPSRQPEQPRATDDCSQETADWKTYSSHEGEFEVRYPPTWDLHVQKEGTKTFLIFRSPETETFLNEEATPPTEGGLPTSTYFDQDLLLVIAHSENDVPFDLELACQRDIGAPGGANWRDGFGLGELPAYNRWTRHDGLVYSFESQALIDLLIDPSGQDCARREVSAQPARDVKQILSCFRFTR
jgi:hypothetical protein